MDLSPFLFGLYKLVKHLIYPYTWLCLLLGALTLLAFLPPSPQRLRWIKILAASSSLIVFVLGLPLVGGTMLGLVEQQAGHFNPQTAQPFDAIVVLGGGVDDKGSLRPSVELDKHSIRRTICGADLFERGLAPRLVLTGGDASIFGEGPLEASELAKLARRLGVPEEAIILETRSRTTYENAVQTRRLLGEPSVVVVTSASHVSRAVALFRKQGMTVEGYACGYKIRDRPGDLGRLNLFDLIPSLSALGKSTTAISELVGTVVYWLVGKI